jgi:glycosyltransferase involved in cell wall biosynthesis
MFIDLTPIDFSTRERKLAQTLADQVDVEYVSLSNAGRSGFSVTPGRSTVGGVRALAVRNRAMRSNRSSLASMENLATGYLPGLARLFSEVLLRRPRVLVVGSGALLLPAVCCSLFTDSVVVYDARERMAAVRTPHSLATAFSRFERPILRLLRRQLYATFCVAPLHAREYASVGLERVTLLRNVPAARVGTNWYPPQYSPSRPLRIALIGSLYSGRGVEAMVQAVAMARADGLECEVRIAGFASPEYRASIEDLIRKTATGDLVELQGPLSHDEVFEAYLQCDLISVLYEATDRANDSLSNKLFEAISTGRGVLATNLSQTRDLVNQHRVGLCCEVDVAALAGAFFEVRDHPELVDRFAWNSRSAAEELTWENESRAAVESILSALR